MAHYREPRNVNKGHEPEVTKHTLQTLCPVASWEIPHSTHLDQAPSFCRGRP